MAHSFRILSTLPLLVGLSACFLSPLQATLRPETYWQVDDVRPGMKGVGRTVMHATKIEEFEAEVIGVLRNVNPGRDMILCRLAGLNLDKTGVIAGMSGSPIYIDGKLLGAVAYAWQYGKEPIAGITPFVQMDQFVAAYERRDVADKERVKRIGLAKPVDVQGQHYDQVTVSNDYRDARPTSSDGLWMVPLRTPIASTGMSTGSLAVLQNNFNDMGMVPVQGGAVSVSVSEEDRISALLPGSACSVALITGDFDLSAIGTVTHVEDKRVYAFGHPFMGLGACDLPLMTGYVHTIFPRQTLSFKMGSPLRPVGVINADVSTCIAGWLDRTSDMLPVSMTVIRELGIAKTFNVHVVRQRDLLSGLVQTALTNSVDMEGDLPEEMTALFKIRMEVADHGAIVLEDTFSGTSVGGNRAPQALFSQAAQLVNSMTYNSIGNLYIKSIECTTEIQPGRRTADIDCVELDADEYAPGDTVKAAVFLKPYKGARERYMVALKLPADLPDGQYFGSIGDDLSVARQELRDSPQYQSPANMDNLFTTLQIITAAKRTNLAMRVGVGATGVAVGGKALPNLPGGMVQSLSSTRRSGVQQINSSLVARQQTGWVVQGSEAIHFEVNRNKSLSQ